MSFFDAIRAFFGGKKNTPYAPPGSVEYLENASSASSRPKSKQVYEGRYSTVPEWAQGLNNTDLPEELAKHVVCRYTPNFGMKKIMSATVGPDGNLVPEYEGIGGDCGAIKNFGMKIAKRDGYLMPYRYFDLDMAYKACCDNPKKCPFFLAATGEADATSSRQRKI
ncbi:MAG: hypothetical protein GX946_09795 [Oligosphaeraceae bacterium]|nr:hypothetical protein [Oligosphaeraceae bacterium]